MKVSIIIPVYGVEKYLAKCLDSLVTQTLKDIEIIVVNDGTKDNSQKIIDKYQKKYPKLIKAYIKENGGQGSARNYGLEYAKGEYIGYVDSDDYVDPTMFEKLYNTASKNNSDMVICGNYVVSEDYSILKTELLNFPTDKHNCKDNYNLIFDKMAVWNKIYKKELILNNKIDFRSQKWYEDLDFTIPLLLKSKRIDFVNEPLYYYLLREGSTMNNKNVTRNLEIIESFDSLYHRVDVKKYYEEIEYLTILHVLVPSSVRVIQINDKDTKKIVKELVDYSYSKFPNLEHNKYLKNNKKFKLLIFLIKHNMYGIIRLMFKIKNKIA